MRQLIRQKKCLRVLEIVKNNPDIAIQISAIMDTTINNETKEWLKQQSINFDIFKEK